jgi:ADP-ribose pyrophosphatase
MSGRAAADGMTTGRAGPAEEWLVDVVQPRPVMRAETVHSGLVWDVVRDTVDLGPGGVVRREYLRHPGAVAILAMDGDGRVALVHQYRHPVRMVLWELPAGLLDVAGEPPLQAARRELKEEADLLAQRWDVLVDWFNSPGGMDEALRVYLARDLSPVPPSERHVREAEEHGMAVGWATLDEGRDAILAGRMRNPAAVVGILAACAARDLGWSTLRPADTPWHYPRPDS